MVVHVSVDRGELLQRLHLSEPQHRSLSSSKWKVAVLGSIVLPPSTLLAVEIALLAHRRRIGAEPVCDNGLGAAVAFERLLHEGQSRGFVSCSRDVALEDFPS